MPRHDKLQEAIERLVQLQVSIRLGDVSREAGPALLHEIETELRRFGITDQRLSTILQDVDRTAEAIASVRIAAREADSLQPINESDPPSRRSEFSEILHESERDADVRLTAAARNLLRIPAFEVFELTDEWNNQQLRTSVATIMETVRDSELTELDKRAQKRTSIAVLWAIHKRWCSIPPFCVRVDRSR